MFLSNIQNNKQWLNTTGKLAFLRFLFQKDQKFSNVREIHIYLYIKMYHSCNPHKNTRFYGKVVVHTCTRQVNNVDLQVWLLMATFANPSSVSGSTVEKLYIFLSSSKLFYPLFKPYKDEIILHPAFIRAHFIASTATTLSKAIK